LISARKRIVQLVTVFVIFGITSLLVNNIFFLHFHILPNGETVYHTHPYSQADESDGTSHTHTKEELTLIDSVTHPYFTLSEVSFGCDCNIQSIEYINPFPSFVSFKQITLPNLRGPPLA
jgi:hypothetical protein